MAFVVSSEDCRQDKVVGIKLDISPEILPRDTSIGTKIFMLVPNEAQTVRDVKSYIAKFVLKTPSPFHFFMGEYRIQDEEDAQIFSIINEPCRLVSVPVPRSALSSTPKIKSTMDKRVTFFDGDLTTSPVENTLRNGLDLIDAADRTKPGQNLHTPPEELVIPSTINAQKLTDNDQSADLSDSSAERKKRRRRRHRNKKSKPLKDYDLDDINDSAVNGSESTSQSNDCASNSTETCQVHTHFSSNSNNGKNQLDILNEETESEDETAGESSRPKDFEFVTPISTNKMSRKRSDQSTGQGGKKKKLSDSAFESESSGNFASPISTSDESSSSSGKKRQDTPIVPRVIRNPKLFDSARNIFDAFDVSNENCQKNNSEIISSENLTKIKMEVEDNESSYESKPTEAKSHLYENLRSIGFPEEINAGDHIAFKVLELDERYNPTISAYKEGIIKAKMGTQYRILYTKNSVVVRIGKYELVDENEDMENRNRKQDIKQEEVELYFNELIEPKLISQRKATTSMMLPIQGNGNVSPPSVI